jgi:hypothetical protein
MHINQVGDVSPMMNELIIMIKPEFTRLLSDELIRLPQLLMQSPEALAKGLPLAHPLRRWSATLKKYSVRIKGVEVVHCPLRREKIISTVYTTLSAGAKSPSLVLHEEAKKILLMKFGEKSSAQVRGGHEILRKYPGLTASTLQQKVDASGNVKLGANLYASRVTIQGKTETILNGFFPHQHEHLVHDPMPLIGLRVATSCTWGDIRDSVVGGIDPQFAREGSVRRILSQSVDSLTFSIALNGAHVSPGPLEGYRQVQAFFARKNDTNWKTDSTFLQGLSQGLKDGPFTVEDCLENALIKLKGVKIPIFEATENTDASKAIAIISTAAAENRIFPDSSRRN